MLCAFLSVLILVGISLIQYDDGGVFFEYLRAEPQSFLRGAVFIFLALISLSILFNRIWPGFLITALFLDLLCVVSNVKLLNRGMPLLPWDYTMALEAAGVAGNYEISMTAMAVYDGIGQSAQPILAAASGAGLKDRIQCVFRRAVMLELIGTTALALAYIVLAGPIAALFSIREGELLSLALTGIRIYALSIPLTGLNSIIMYYFQAQEKAGRGLAISLLSGSVLLIAALLTLTALFGVQGVWFSWLAAQSLTLMISIALFRKEQGGLKK